MWPRPWLSWCLCRDLPSAWGLETSLSVGRPSAALAGFLCVFPLELGLAEPRAIPAACGKAPFSCFRLMPETSEGT